MGVLVSFDDLLAAHEWVSSGGTLENRAYVSRTTGNIHLSSEAGIDEELPEDVEDENLYVAVPHKNHLDLGRALALRFVSERLPGSYELAHGYFRKSGAYGRFKSLLERTGQLDAWYEYEASSVERALREWGADHGLQFRA
jgi:hypothetical protein